MITIYGVAPSRTARCLWLLEEMGLEYDRELVHWDDDGAKRAAYLELNPNGRVPCLVDGDLVLFESLAINLYLVRRYGGPLALDSIEDEARALQWSFWATNEIDPLLSVLTNERAYNKPDDPRWLILKKARDLQKGHVIGNEVEMYREKSRDVRMSNQIRVIVCWWLC